MNVPCIGDDCGGGGRKGQDFDCTSCGPSLLTGNKFKFCHNIYLDR